MIYNYLTIPDLSREVQSYTVAVPVLVGALFVTRGLLVVECAKRVAKMRQINSVSVLSALKKKIENCGIMQHLCR